MMEKSLKVEQKLSADAILPKPRPPRVEAGSRLIAIGASTGGTRAIEQLLRSLNRDTPGIVIVQHMPESFTESFAHRLDNINNIPVKLAEDGERVEDGHVYVAPGNRHLIVDNQRGNLYLTLKDGPPVNRHRPSVDVLFRSVAQSVASQALGIILTGMGDDGANGMKEMRDAGACTLAQDESSCVVFGMPAVAIARGGVNRVCLLDEIARLMNAFNHQPDFKGLMRD